MSKTYDEIMDKIQMDNDMRQRILQNIEQKMEEPEDSKQSEVSEQPDKIFSIHKVKISRWLSAAACLVLLVTGVAVVPRFQRDWSEPSVEESGMAGVANDIETCISAEELSQKLGFPVSDLNDLPFVAEKTEYTSYWGEFGQIDYEGTDANGKSQSLSYRKGIGTEDISGDYNTYEVEKTTEAGGTQVTLKGNAGGYLLAIWTKDGYSYAISVTNGLSEEEITAIIEKNVGI